MRRLENLRSIVTGAGAGIGAVIARRLAREGARVAVTDVDLEAAERVAEEIGNRALAARLDVTSEREVTYVLGEIADRWGGVDGVVNNAGVGARGTVETASAETLEHVLAVNVVGTFLVMRHAVPLLRRSDRASIVNIGSIVALVGLPNRAAVAASKGAVHALTRAAAIDHAAEGIRVNCIAPGAVDTPWVQRMASQSADPERELEQMLARQPHGRLVTCEEVAAAAAYLLSDEAASLVGECLVIDGGATAR